jgi:hypothetical protein
MKTLGEAVNSFLKEIKELKALPAVLLPQFFRRSRVNV